MKKTISTILICLLLLSLTAACGNPSTVVETLPPGEVQYYLREYVHEFGLGDSSQRTVYTYDDQWRMRSWSTTLEGTDNDTETMRGNFSYSEDNRIMTFTDGSGVIT